MDAWENSQKNIPQKQNDIFQLGETKHPQQQNNYSHVLS